MTAAGEDPYLAIARRFATVIPHIDAIGIELEAATRAVATLRLPWREDLVGNIDTGFVHGGVITTLIDSTSGLSVFLAMEVPRSIATLDLRIDYLRPPTARATLHARAECYRVTRHVAFVRASAYHPGDDRTIATSASTFLLDSPGRPLGPAARTPPDAAMKLS